MFLHHTMTDSEILRTTEGCDSHHLRLLADRLRERLDDLKTIGTSARAAMSSHDYDVIKNHLADIEDVADPSGK